ncbi:hypothetical protein [Zavarzinella formosa]|uniref:hypothetical protein n=1 Tax=Zavarzinella formosa TaxID=360055 RepID=UPI0002DAADFF|nr:hypothetical protein [Zavarzinella formosa]
MYYPTKVGDTLVYETTFGDGAVEEVMVVIKVEPTDAGMIVTTGRKICDEVTPISRMEVTPNGLTRTWYANMDLKPPAQLLKLLATPGDTWTVKSTATFPSRTSTRQ